MHESRVQQAPGQSSTPYPPGQFPAETCISWNLIPSSFQRPEGPYGDPILTVDCYISDFTKLNRYHEPTRSGTSADGDIVTIRPVDLASTSPFGHAQCPCPISISDSTSIPPTSSTPCDPSSLIADVPIASSLFLWPCSWYPRPYEPIRVRTLHPHLHILRRDCSTPQV